MREGLSVRRRRARKPRNRDRRTREYLTEQEVEVLMRAAGRTGRHGHRDRTMILIAYRHGLRVSEPVALRWEQVDLGERFLHVNRMKRGTASTHPLCGPELPALRRLRRDDPEVPHLFVSMRRKPLTPLTVRKMIASVGQRAGPFPAHPHMPCLCLQARL